MTRPSTRRGRESRARIVTAAATLMHERGVVATSVDDVLAASGTGKSQFYHYFSGKEELVDDVLRHQLLSVLETLDAFDLKRWEDIEAWLEASVTSQENQGYLGCPLGSIAGEVVGQGDRLRATAAESFREWNKALATGLERMRTRGLLAPDANVDALAETTLAILQGGYLLSSVRRDSEPMRQAIAVARREMRSWAVVQGGADAIREGQAGGP
jgi:AcrR family transcriptional regulator